MSNSPPDSSARSDDDVGDTSPGDEPLALRAWLPTALGKAPVGRAKVTTRCGRVSRHIAQRMVRRTRRRRRITAMIAVLALVTGVGMVAGTVFFASVELPEDLDDHLAQNSTLYYSDGKTQLATIGAEKRTSVSLDEVPDHMRWALIAAEDQNFYQHDGVDFWGVLRAMWNNVSGGSTQGASTLVQQYAGQVADIRGDDSYMRKAQEAAMAMKMDSRYSKDTILNHYLNLVYFGRGAYGVEAGAKAFFGKPAAELTVGESALLVAQIKSPDGSLDPDDPLDVGKDKVTARIEQRWSYVLDAMVGAGKLSRDSRADLTSLPDTVDPDDDPGAAAATGFISHSRVLEELQRAGIASEEVRRGGYEIVTTIDSTLQEAVMKQAKEAEDSDDKAAAVAIEPATGRVLAYYGGPKGTMADQAGDAAPHPPGTTFHLAPAVAALEDGISTASRWHAQSPREFDDRDEAVENIGGADREVVTLDDALQDGLDTAIYAVTDEVGAESVADVASRMGVSTVREPADVKDPDTLDTSNKDAEWSNDLGLGAYPVSVFDSAAMYATLGADGIHSPSHFVKSVTGDDGKIHDDGGNQTTSGIDFEIASNINAVLFSGDDGTHGVDASSTWYNGYCASWAMSVWAGDDKSEGDGSSTDNTTAQGIWEEVAKTADELYPPQYSGVPPTAEVGDDDAGEAS